MTLAYISTRRSSGRMKFSVAGKINDGLINDDTKVLFDRTIVWTIYFPVASKINDELTIDDTSLLLDKTTVWNYGLSVASRVNDELINDDPSMLLNESIVLTVQTAVYPGCCPYDPSIET